jgi:hypothetical protein
MMKVIGRRGLLFVHGVILFCVGSSLYVIATDQEYWPFSPYPMYSGLQRGDYKRMQAFGVTENGEVALIPETRYLRPFDYTRLPTALKRLHRHPNGLELIDNALQDCFDRYEAGRRARVHDGLSLHGIRLYELSWQLDPWARNANQPESKKLIYEFNLRNP